MDSSGYSLAWVSYIHLSYSVDMECDRGIRRKIWKSHSPKKPCKQSDKLPTPVHGRHLANKPFRLASQVPSNRKSTFQQTISLYPIKIHDDMMIFSYFTHTISNQICRYIYLFHGSYGLKLYVRAGLKCTCHLKGATVGGWKGEKTTWDIWNPTKHGIHYQSTGAGFQPSTVVIWCFIFLLPFYISLAQGSGSDRNFSDLSDLGDPGLPWFAPCAKELVAMILHPTQRCSSCMLLVQWSTLSQPFWLPSWASWIVISWL